MHLRGGGRPVAAGCSFATALVLGLGVMHAACAQKLFGSPDAAMNAFGDAVIADDAPAMRAILGARFRTFIPPAGDEVRRRFVSAWGAHHEIRLEGGHAYLAVGDDGWTLPIPLVKSPRGWHFDARAGMEEMRVRRIERNEMSVIQAMEAVGDALPEYVRVARHGSGMSTGAAPNLLTVAFRPRGTRHTVNAGFYGYRYKRLIGQGEHAPGGAFAYASDDGLPDGFAILAWPVRYRDTGVMTFMVSQDGQVYERDLGGSSATKAAETAIFDPGPGWRKVSP